MSTDVTSTIFISILARQRDGDRHPRKTPQITPVNIQGVDIEQTYKFLCVHLSNKLDFCTRRAKVIFTC